MIQLTEKEKRAFMFLLGSLWGSAMTAFLQWIVR